MRSGPTDQGRTVRFPGSKSISNRALPMAALSEGVADVRYLLHSDDTECRLDGMRALGVGIGKLESHVFRV